MFHNNHPRHKSLFRIMRPFLPVVVLTLLLTFSQANAKQSLNSIGANPLYQAFVNMTAQSCHQPSTLVEAEAGTLFGGFVVGNDSAASSGQFVHVPDNTESFKDGPSEHYVELCFSLSAAGDYQLLTQINGISSEANSFYATFDDFPTEGYLWDTAQSGSFEQDYISDRDGDDPVLWNLAAGDRVLRIYLREDGTQLDWVEIERVGNSPPTLTHPGDQINVESETVSLQISATDIDGDDILYTADNLPPTLLINEETGLISGQLTATSAGSYSVEVMASDDEDSASISFTWTVTDRPEAAIDIQTLTEGVDADSPTGPLIAAGDTVNWTYFATNSGDFELVDVVISDDELGTICTISSLPIGGSGSCAASATAAAGQYSTVGRIVADPVDENGDPATHPDDSLVAPPTDSDPTHYLGYTALNASINIEMETNGIDADDPTGPILDIGETVTWSYIVTNDGDVNLEDVTVTDSERGQICTIAALDSGETATCTETAAAVSGQYAATATVTGDPVDINGDPATQPNGDPIPAPLDSDSSHYFGADAQIPAITLQKRVYSGHDNGTSCEDGQEIISAVVNSDITYCFDITNTGSTYLADLSLDDPALNLSLNDLTAVSIESTPLAPGDSATYYYEASLDADLINVATTSADPVDENNVPYVDLLAPTDSDSAEVQLFTGELCATGSRERFILSGQGIGNRNHAQNPATLSLPSHIEATHLSAQLIGQLRPDLTTAVAPSLVTYQSSMESISLAEPTQTVPYAYAFETDLIPVSSFTTSWQDFSGGYQTARGIVTLSSYPTEGTFINLSNMNIGFVYHRIGQSSVTSVLNFAPTTAVTTIFVQAAVVGHHDDANELVVNAQAGTVADSVTLSHLSGQDQLEIVNIVLTNVPAGTSSVKVTLISPNTKGDSGILGGVVATVQCSPDFDQDGVPDLDEGELNTDNDTLLDSQDADDDNDGVLSIDEDINGNHTPEDDDTDGDGIPNYLDDDDDGDSILTLTELYHLSTGGSIGDFDHDGIPNYLDPDDDNDGLLTIDEAGLVDGFGPDADGDGIVDSIEGTSDKDGDEIPNYLDDDSDNDNILDKDEGAIDMDGDDIPNFLDQDADGDTIFDAVEGAIDTDGDGKPNYLDTDSDNDTVPDFEERTKDRDHDEVKNYLDSDADNDGVYDYDEYVQTDSHLLIGCSSWEVAVCTKNNVDGDKTPNYLDMDSDEDGILDKDEQIADLNGDGEPNIWDAENFKFLYLPVIIRN